MGNVSVSQIQGAESLLLKSIGNGHSILIEKINLDDVDTSEYIHKTSVGENSVEYNDLSANILNEILSLLEEHEAQCKKQWTNAGIIISNFFQYFPVPDLIQSTSSNDKNNSPSGHA